MQCLPGESPDRLRVGCLVAASIERIADQRMADIGQMDPDLVGPSCLEPAFDQRGLHAEPLQYLVMGDGRLAGGGHRHFLPVALAAADRPLDPVPGFRRHTAHHGGRLALGGETAGGERPLRDRIDLAVGAHERGNEENTALKVGCVAKRAHGHIYMCALRGEWRKVGGNHDGGHIVGFEGGAARVDAEAFQHADEALLGEGGLAERVAGAVQADDQAIAHQHVVAHALHIDDILDARAGLGLAGEAGHEQTGHKGTRQNGGKAEILEPEGRPEHETTVQSLAIRFYSKRKPCHEVAAGSLFQAIDFVPLF